MVREQRVRSMEQSDRPAAPRSRNQLTFTILIALLALSPLPFGSARPVWIFLILPIIGLLLILVLRNLSPDGVRLRRFNRVVLPAMTVHLLVCLWAFLQSTPWLGELTANPLWQQPARHLAGLSGQEYLSLNPGDTRATALIFAAYGALFASAFFILHSRPRATMFIKGFFIISALYAAYGVVAQILAPDRLLWFEKWAYEGFVTSTFVNRNSFATYCALGLVAGAGLIYRFMDKFDPVSGQKRRVMMVRFLAHLATHGWPLLAGMGALLTALMMTGSRAGLLAALVGMSVVLALCLWRGRQRGARGLLAGAGVLVLGLALLFAFSGDQTISRLNKLDKDGEARIAAYHLMIEGIEERPLTGYGLGSFREFFIANRDASFGHRDFRRGHNDYLELALGVGVIAAAAWLLAILGLLVIILRNVVSEASARPMGAICALGATAAVAVHSLVDFSLQIPAVAIAYVTLLACGLSRSTRDD